MIWKLAEKNGLLIPFRRDDQESIATMGVMPGMNFTPDSKALIASYGGKIYRIPVDGAKPTEIPFTANVTLELGPRLEFKYPVSDSSHALGNTNPKCSSFSRWKKTCLHCTESVVSDGLSKRNSQSD